ncbi:MAG TPA: sterol-binding protein [Rhodobacteraceae bacterium]|nr:SCP2 sterol-binding domain-containing protein [Paracoccaceae bacterium]HBG97460.1 sterol-binding protein [Paracoccaceae bacterium]
MPRMTDASRTPRGPRLPLPPLPLFLLDPILRRVARKVAAENPDLFDRLGEHRHSWFLIDPVNLPFMLYLRPDPDALDFRAVPKGATPPHAARIAGRFLRLLSLMEGDEDGDALFFSRDLTVTGDTEAIVCLRNALDDVERPVAETVADMFGPPGRIALRALREAAARERQQAEAQP